MEALDCELMALNPAIADGILRCGDGSDKRHTVMANDHGELIFIGTEINEFIITGPEGTDLFKAIRLRAEQESRITALTHW